MKGNLAGRVAIVSGSGRGIGRATAIKLAAEGASVVVNDIDDAAAAETIAQIEQNGGRAVACNGDVTENDFGDRFVASALSAFDGLDIIVNNAGYTWDGVVQHQTDQQFQAMLDVHVMAPFRTLRAALAPIRRLREAELARGEERVRKVVNISSISGTGGNPGQINYASAKSAVIGMTKTLAKEWGRYAVCVNCVAFGLIRTRLTQDPVIEATTVSIRGQHISAGIPERARAQMLDSIPLGREGTADEAAGGIYLMCSPESDYISGQILMVSGGWSS